MSDDTVHCSSHTGPDPNLQTAANGVGSALATREDGRAEAEGTVVGQAHSLVVGGKLHDDHDGAEDLLVPDAHGRRDAHQHSGRVELAAALVLNQVAPNQHLGAACTPTSELHMTAKAAHAPNGNLDHARSLSVPSSFPARLANLDHA